MQMESRRGPFREGPVIKIADHASKGILLDLAVADHIGEVIASAVSAAARETLVLVDLSGVETRASCLARFLGKPLKALQSDRSEPGARDVYVILKGPLGSNELDTALALESQGVVVVVRGPDGPALVGKVDPVVKETYSFFSQQEEVTSAMLTEAPYNLKITTANARVAKLHSLGLLHRLREEVLESGGRRFVYAPVR